MEMGKRILVIGSGFGGLGFAVRLAAKGHDVELFEQRDKPGGRAYVYHANGFTFDGGPTVVTAPFMFDDLFATAGGDRRNYVEPILTQSAWFRPHNQSEDFENLFFVGAGTHPGAGLPGVLSSAKIVADFF
jgi:phytoene dehydrogenase-like protein